MKQEFKIKLRKGEKIQSVIEVTQDGPYKIFRPKEGMKICNRCFFVWDTASFYKNKKSPDGLRNECQNCSSTITEKSKEDMEKLRRIFKIAIRNNDDGQFPFNLKEAYQALEFTNLKKTQIKNLKSIMFDYYDKLEN